MAHFTCTIALQRIALRTKAWFSVATSQLAGQRHQPDRAGRRGRRRGDAVPHAGRLGQRPATAVGGLTAFSLLGIAGLLALPIFVLPAIVAGTPIDRGLEHAALLGIGAFVLFAGFGAVVLVSTGRCAGPAAWSRRCATAAAQAPAR